MRDWFQVDASGRVVMAGRSQDLPVPANPAWQVVEGAAQVGDRFDVATGQVLPPDPLLVAQSSARAQVAAALSRFEAQFLGGVTAGEIASWDKKAEMAQAYLSGQPAPMIEVEAAILGQTPSQVAQTIVARAALYPVAAAIIAGIRRGAASAIDGAATPEEIPAAVAGVFAAAQAAAAQHGIEFPQ